MNSDSCFLADDIDDLHIENLVSMREAYIPPHPLQTRPLSPEDQRVQGIFNEFKTAYLKTDDIWSFTETELREAISTGVRSGVFAEGVVIPANASQRDERFFILSKSEDDQSLKVSFCNKRDVLGVGGYGIVVAGYRLGTGPSAFKMVNTEYSGRLNPTDLIIDEARIRETLWTKNGQKELPGLPPPPYALYQITHPVAFDAMEMPRFSHTLLDELHARVGKRVPIDYPLIDLESKNITEVLRKVAIGLFQGLELLHQYTIHHDICPRNIAIERGRAFLIDFRSQKKGLPPLHSRIGPFDAHYMSTQDKELLFQLIKDQGHQGCPESVTDPDAYYDRISRLVDVFQLCTTLFKACMGFKPYLIGSDDSPQMPLRIEAKALARMGAPSEFNELFLRGLQFNPNERISCDEALKLLRCKD